MSQLGVGLIVLAAILLAVGVILLTRNDQEDPWKKWRSREIGSSLLAGTFFTLGLFALQAYLDEEAKDGQFRITIGVTRHLEGLDPERSLKGMHLSHKVLNYAKLKGEDLRDTTLRGASLKGADLRKADLRRADLTEANLTNAKLVGADLRGAKLQSAELRDAQIYRKGKKGEEALGIDLGGTQVNADTCWPDDFLSTPDFATVRDEDLVRKAKIVQGQYLGKPSLGYACGLMPDSVLQVEAPTSQGLSLDKAATAFGVGTKRVVNALMGEEEVKPRPDAPTFVARPCAGSHKIRVRLGNWVKGHSLLIVDPPDADAPRVMVLSWDDVGALGPTPNLPQPLNRTPD